MNVTAGTRVIINLKNMEEKFPCKGCGKGNWYDRQWHDQKKLMPEA